MRSSVSFLLLIIFAKIYRSNGNNATTKSSLASVLRKDFNFGHSEYVYLPSDPSPPSLGLSKCPNYDVNKTVCSFVVNNNQRNGSDLAVMKAWTAVTLRDNIVTILGLLLHARNNTLIPQDVYAPLYLLYREVQRNNIKTMELISLLKTIVKSERVHQQLATLFKGLGNVMPFYCKNAADDLARAFSKMKMSKLKSILLSEAIVDKGSGLLHDIEPILEPLLRTQMVNESYDRRLEEFHGREFAIFFAKITDGSVHLTQPVLAVLMLNLRYNEMRPDDTEEFRYLADILRNNKIENWTPNVNVDENDAKDPYDLVHASLTALLKVPDVDEEIRNIVARLLSKLGKPSNTSANPHYMDMKLFLGKSKLNVTLMLDRLVEEVSTTEASTLRDIVLEDKINLNFALKGFVRYYYNSPQELILAFLNRIRHRVPMTSSMRKFMKILSTQVGLVGFRQHFNVVERKKRNADDSKIVNILLTTADLHPLPFCSLCDNPHKSFTDLFNIMARMDSYGGASSVPTTSPNELKTCQNVSTGTALNAWLETLNMSSTDVLSSTLFENVSTILGTIMNNTEILLQIQPFILRKANDTKRDQLLSVLKKLLTLKKVQAMPVVHYEAVRLYCVLVHNASEHLIKQLTADTTLDESPPTNLMAASLMINNVSLPIATLLNDTKFTENLSMIKPENYPTKRLFLEALFKRMLALEMIRNDTVLFNEIIRLLRSIQSLEIKFDELTKTLIIESTEEASWMVLVNDFLSRPNLLTILGEDFDIGRYPTKGAMLKAILEKALNATIVKEDARLLTAVQKMIPKIDCSHRGAEMLDAVRVNLTTSDCLNFYKLINGTIDRNKVTPEVEQSFSNMLYGWHEGSFDLSNYMRKLNVTQYNTKADFLVGFYDNLVRIIEEEATKKRKDIEVMKSAILTTGTGAEPVDYI